MRIKNKRYKVRNKHHLGSKYKCIKTIHVEKGNKLSELLGKCVYRVRPSSNGDRSYMSLFESVVIPFKVTKHGVYIIRCWLLFGIDNEMEFELVKDEYGWEDITPILKETLVVQEKLLVSYEYSKASIFDNRSRQVKELLMTAGYVAVGKEREWM